jgi:hypothetical protein
MNGRRKGRQRKKTIFSVTLPDTKLIQTAWTDILKIKVVRTTETLPHTVSTELHGLMFLNTTTFTLTVVRT